MQDHHMRVRNFGPVVMKLAGAQLPSVTNQSEGCKCGHQANPVDAAPLLSAGCRGYAEDWPLGRPAGMVGKAYPNVIARPLVGRPNSPS